MVEDDVDFDENIEDVDYVEVDDNVDDNKVTYTAALYINSLFRNNYQKPPSNNPTRAGAPCLTTEKPFFQRAPLLRATYPRPNGFFSSFALCHAMLYTVSHTLSPFFHTALCSGFSSTFSVGLWSYAYWLYELDLSK